MTDYPNPSIATHVALTESLPPENQGALVGRPDLPTPHLWQKQVKVRHKVTGKPAVVVRTDYGTCMFRAFFPDEMNNEGTMGRFSERTEWYHFKDWDVETTFSPAELERQAAKTLLENQIAKLDAKQIALARVLCDDPDPNKALAKLQMLISADLVKMPESLAPAVLPEEPVMRTQKKAAPKVEP